MVLAHTTVVLTQYNTIDSSEVCASADEMFPAQMGSSDVASAPSSAALSTFCHSPVLPLHRSGHQCDVVCGVHRIKACVPSAT